MNERMHTNDPEAPLSRREALQGPRMQVRALFLPGAGVEMINTYDVLSEVFAERKRQDAKWGEQNHPDGTGADFRTLARISQEECDYAAHNGSPEWRLILQEEVAEAFAESDPAKLREELIQVAAVACSWVEAIDRREQAALVCTAPRNDLCDRQASPCPAHSCSVELGCKCHWGSGQ